MEHRREAFLAYGLVSLVEMMIAFWFLIMIAGYIRYLKVSIRQIISTNELQDKNASSLPDHFTVDITEQPDVADASYPPAQLNSVYAATVKHDHRSGIYPSLA
jgi:hypothetical protein